MTIMYAGYQQELRDMMRNPTGIFSPHWTPTYLGTRFLVVLFWFVVSLAFTAAMPGTISRGVARLQLTSLRVAAIGLIGVVVLFVSVLLCLWSHAGAGPGARRSAGRCCFGWSRVCSVELFCTRRPVGGCNENTCPFGKNSEAVALYLGPVFGCC